MTPRAFWRRLSVAKASVCLFLLASPGYAGAIHNAVTRGDVTQVAVLLSRDPSLVHSEDAQGLTPLLLAAEKGKGAIVEYLIRNGADVNEKNTELGITALQFAADKGYGDVVTRLIAHNADVNLADKTGFTPLLEAVKRG